MGQAGVPDPDGPWIWHTKDLTRRRSLVGWPTGRGRTRCGVPSDVRLGTLIAV